MLGHSTRRLLPALAVCLAELVPIVPGSTQTAVAARAIERDEVAPGIYLFRVAQDAFGGPGNSVVIVNDSDVVVFDTNMRPSSAEMVIAEIRKLTDKPVRRVINSHWHQDHWGGNGVYAREYPGVQIIATEQTRDFMMKVNPLFARGFAGNLKRLQATLEIGKSTGKNRDGTPFTPDDQRQLEGAITTKTAVMKETTFLRTLPTFTYRDRLSFRSGKREFALMSMDGDASASTVLYLPREQVLLVGDLLVQPEQWGNNGYALKPWIDDLQKLKDLKPKAIVPGHGPMFKDDAYLSLVLDLFGQIRTQTRAALDGGAVSLDDVKKVLKLDSLRARFKAIGASFSEDALIEMAYREARDGMIVS